ncbi:hypothetical protein GZ176_11905 [Dermatophilus congolensis]|nr:hypothetical protein [Dermatophilus congolensis]MBO3146372.1 hypothetical protein [Dermatophilus congolensis]MBO3148585.1 hypothetical protein [Dermatophilus congolensis]MBO3157564.1 hypothetical protein [Dermatophilus congolensis]MBO3159901.1 hypothetical protein [Dermatophilus congolensis]MBO3166640.1 hypothetical protein [Dermatophilus congolensis]
MDKDLRKIVKALEKQGYTVTLTRRNHVSVSKDGKRVATFSGTPSDRRSLLNGIAALRRTGFTWPPQR